jgi:hypothetical protein
VDRQCFEVEGHASRLARPRSKSSQFSNAIFLALSGKLGASAQLPQEQRMGSLLTFSDLAPHRIMAILRGSQKVTLPLGGGR